MPIDKVNLEAAFARFDERWSPRIAGELNGQMVKLVKVEGEFVWHHHDAEDELFLVIRGRLRMRLRDHEGAPPRELVLEPGEMVIVPRGVEHQPVGEGETWILLFEPASTVNTGNLRNERTVERLERL
jgi:mannose-6-phosphate isomerase-like protein (cupin superfamily)